MSIVGSGTVPSASGTGTATVTFDLVFDTATRRWSGTVIVNDPGAGFSATVAVTAGRQGIIRAGTTTGGILKGVRALSVPRRGFTLVFEIDDIA